MFWRGVLGYLPVNIAQGVVGLLTLVVFTRLLTPAEFGHYALGFAVMSLLHTAVFTWNEAALARFQVAELDRGSGADHAATVQRTWLVLLLGALPLAALALLVWPLSGPLKLAVLAGLGAILPRTMAKLAQERRRAIGDVRGAAAIDLVQILGGFAIGAVCAMAGLGGASPLIGFGVAAALSVVWAVPQEIATASGGRFQPARARRYAGYGIPVAASLILTLVLTSTDRFMLAAFLDEAAVGLYHAGYSLASRTIDVLFIWLGTAGGPALVAALERGGREGLAAEAREQASLMLLLTAPATVGLVLVAAPLCELMVGQDLRDGAAHVTPWIAASALLSGLTTYYFHQAYTLGRRTGLLIAVMAAPALANLALNLVLIPACGLDGALWATLTSYAIGLVASILLGRKVLPMPIPWAPLAQAAFASAAMAAVVVCIPPLGGIVELFLKVAVGALVYCGLVLAMDAGGLRSRALPLLRRFTPGAAA
ncbi:MAG: lipopolysaccharide biosynthesis protein [Phenylobacterium sp.]|uniref:polysaccharide biosynthesis protein HfsF n=1 Tax=Phenylobacterium sp. TaxID=1871053 RepID=UPI00355CBADB